VFVHHFPSGALAANCYVLGATRAGQRPVAGERPDDCVIIDPGQDAVSHLVETLGRNLFRPVAVLLTHGHLDHVASAAQVCRTFGIPAYLHDGDAFMLDDPLAGLSPQLRAGISALIGPDDDLTALRPDDLRSLADVTELSLAGLTIHVDHVPGHTPGSVVYRVDHEPAEHLFTGDTLFAGTIGRTDLPGGSTPQILSSIATKLLTRPDDAVVLPGHGPRSTIGAERRSNPFLRSADIIPS
jgi:glyoxylase-like metal-dependent hydrolase (beta-lactamase superfamily II)